MASGQALCDGKLLDVQYAPGQLAPVIVSFPAMNATLRAAHAAD